MAPEIMPTRKKLRELRRLVMEARAVPMSASCMVNRTEVVDMIDEILADLETDLEAYGEKRGARSAEDAVKAARAETDRLLNQTDIVREANTRAAQLLSKARAESEELLVEADRYVDDRLARFEAELQITMTRLGVMRERLQERSNLNHEAEDDATTVLPRWKE